VSEVVRLNGLIEERGFSIKIFELHTVESPVYIVPPARINASFMQEISDLFTDFCQS
jgi:hypothetical protein